jgi:hypothetical protein
VQFTVPDLRPGTLDSLLALSDDLVKVRSRSPTSPSTYLPDVLAVSLI